jgi:hypothetical protein
MSVPNSGCSISSNIVNARRISSPTWFESTSDHATDSVSPIGIWEDGDDAFEMFQSEGKLTWQIVSLREPKMADS